MIPLVLTGLVLSACSWEPAPPSPREERLARRLDKPGEAIPGRFKPVIAAPEDDLEALAALGYVSGSVEAPNEHGVRVLDAEAIQPGANLYVSGQGPEAHLIDRDGTVLHKWAYDWFEQWPDTVVPKLKEFPNHWRRAHLFDDGDLVVIWGGQGMARIDKDSRFVWGLADEHIHHDLDVAPDGMLWTLTRRPMLLEDLSENRVVMDEILQMNAETGAIERRINLWDCFVNSRRYRSMRRSFPSRGDVLHTNTITVLTRGDRDPRFKDGNLLLSFRNVNLLAVVDPVREEVTWAIRGDFVAQHQPVLVGDSGVVLFDNRGARVQRSRILELDRQTGRTRWSYGMDPGEFFYSKILGSVQRLDNGNFLVSESDNGKAFEVTPDKRRVWEFVNPHRAGEHGEFIASLYELVRLPEDQDLSWADPATAERSVKATRRAR